MKVRVLGGNLKPVHGFVKFDLVHTDGISIIVGLGTNGSSYVLCPEDDAYENPDAPNDPEILRAVLNSLTDEGSGGGSEGLDYGWVVL